MPDADSSQGDNVEMPEKVPRLLLCREPYCPAFVEAPGGYCPAHRAGRSRSGSSGYGSRWTRVRNRYFATHPWCELCGPPTPAIDVHHRDGRGPGAPGANDEANLQALCRGCHRKVTEDMKRAAEPRRRRRR